MLASLPRPSASSRAGMSGRTTARGKLAAATQRQREREKLLSVVAKSCEPATHAHHRAAPATPSSVDRASRLSHCSAEKLKQQPVIASEWLVELKLKTSARMSSADSEAQVNFAINLLMEKLVGLHGVLETMTEETRTTNPIVGNVLSMAAKAMGLAKGDEGATAIGLEKGDDDDIELNTADFVSDMLK